MKKQYAMVREQIPDAVFCTNLYGEILELYREGCLQIPGDVILILSLIHIFIVSTVESSSAVTARKLSPSI